MAPAATNGSKRASRSTHAESEEYDESDDEDFRAAMDSVEGVPVYRDGELTIRSVAEPTIVNRKLEQLFSKEDPNPTPNPCTLASMEYLYNEHNDSYTRSILEERDIKLILMPSQALSKRALSSSTRSTKGTSSGTPKDLPDSFSHSWLATSSRQSYSTCRRRKVASIAFVWTESSVFHPSACS